ncbi:MAG: multidrug effflux MFS transporter [Rhodobacterales bacterium]|nr:multidrug effflux MFS transporter [Rhodobacterales bacterium]
MTNSPTKHYLDRKSPPSISTLILLAAISALAMNIYLPSLPNMAQYFGVDYKVMQLSVAVYLAFSGVIQLFIGPISDKFGRRPVILWGVGLFCGATLGCILAPNANIFLIFRMAQAAIAVSMVLGRAAIRDLYSTEKAASMIGYVTMAMAVVPLFGPAIGGFLEQFYGWKANFWILLIGGVAIFTVTWFDFGETARKTSNTLLQQFAEYPELLRSPRFWGYCLASAFGAGAFFAYLGGAPFVGTTVYGLAPHELGPLFGAPGLGYMLGNFISARYSVRFGLNNMVLWGLVFTLLGTALSLLTTYTGNDNVLTFFGFMTIVGLGNGLTIPNATAGMLSVRSHLAGTASGLGGAIMIGGGAGLSALAGAVLHDDTGAAPLLWIMTGSAFAGLVAIRYVMYRQKQLNITL